ncbi:hypothetical protein BJ912DRAFT_1145863 [Pholiota molesta]|nr:hypothetical protein BJ912DRAFT_1145863 [Pholiota molesta]
MDQIYEEITLQTTGHCLVGMHPVEFLDEFLPWDTPTPEAYKETAPGKSRLTKLPFKLVSSRTAPEADIYRILEDTKVEHVASTRLSGDIDALETKAQACFSDLTHSSRHRKPARIPLCHRIVLNTVARDLSTFSWCKVLLSCVADAVEVYEDPESRFHIIPRCPVYQASVIMTLISWIVTYDSSNTRFTFMLLRKQGHIPVDKDTPPFFGFLYYLALMFLQHNYKPRALHQTRQRLFDNTVRETDGFTRFTLPLFGVPGLNKALEDFGRVFEFRYLEEPVLDEPESEEPDSEEPDLEQAKLQKPKLAEPDQKCIPDLLRRVALTMKPLSITPTGLMSPTIE